MKLKELLVKLSQNKYVIQMYQNDFGYNYHIKKLGDHPIGCRFSIVTQSDESPYNLYWDNPTGKMSYSTYQDVYNYLVLNECNGTWSASRFIRY